MQTFPRAHYWLLIPFFIAIAGFSFTYWSNFTTASFHAHVHGLTATSWFILLILQPYLYNKNNLRLHRNLGFIGIFLAGGVVFSALQVVPNNIGSEGLTPVLQYGLTFLDFISVIGFSASVILAMLHRRDLPVHARYMISTAFWALIPALSRLIYFPMVIIYGNPTPISFAQVIYLCVVLTVITLGIMIWMDYKKEQKIYNAYLFVGGGVLTFFLVEVMGTARWWIDLCDRVLAG